MLESPVTNGSDGSGQKVARPGYCGYRTRRFAYVRYSGGVEELYDYREDPLELTNVAGDASTRASSQGCGPPTRSASRDPPATSGEEPSSVTRVTDTRRCEGLHHSVEVM